MDDEVARVLGTAWQDRRPWDVLVALAEFEDRLGGHPGEERAATLLAETFERVGLRAVETQSFAIPEWTRGETSLLVHAYDRDRERTFEAVSLPYCPEATVEGPLVDVGHGTPAELDARDIADAVVVATAGTPPRADRYHHRIEKIAHAAAAGAEGFVFANHRPGQLPPTGSVRAGDTLPAVGVSYETGEWLREYAEEGAAARVNVTASVEPGSSQNVLGETGPDTDEEVLVLAHYDAHDIAEGVLDNGCGVAVLVAVASMLADLELDRRVRFAATGAEELGLQGSETLAATSDTEDVHAVVNIDGAGRDRTLKALTHGSTALRSLAESVTDDVGHPLAVDTRPHPYSDHWPFVKRGVPSLQLHSQSDAGAGGDRWDRGWTHTRADTLDKADRRTVSEHAMLAALIVREIAASDVARLDTDALREAFADAEDAMRTAGTWPDSWA